MIAFYGTVMIRFQNVKKPELSSPTTSTLASFFLNPSAETNLSRNPMRINVSGAECAFLGIFLIDFPLQCRVIIIIGGNSYIDFQYAQIWLSIRRFHDGILFANAIEAIDY